MGSPPPFYFLAPGSHTQPLVPKVQDLTVLFVMMSEREGEFTSSMSMSNPAHAQKVRRRAISKAQHVALFLCIEQGTTQFTVCAGAGCWVLLPLLYETSRSIECGLSLFFFLFCFFFARVCAPKTKPKGLVALSLSLSLVYFFLRFFFFFALATRAPAPSEWTFENNERVTADDAPSAIDKIESRFLGLFFPLPCCVLFAWRKALCCLYSPVLDLVTEFYVLLYLWYFQYVLIMCPSFLSWSLFFCGSSATCVSSESFSRLVTSILVVKTKTYPTYTAQSGEQGKIVALGITHGRSERFV